jgi:hypothetical protein
MVKPLTPEQADAVAAVVAAHNAMRDNEAERRSNSVKRAEAIEAAVTAGASRADIASALGGLSVTRIGQMVDEGNKVKISLASSMDQE